MEKTLNLKLRFVSRSVLDDLTKVINRTLEGKDSNTSGVINLWCSRDEKMHYMNLYNIECNDTFDIDKNNILVNIICDDTLSDRDDVGNSAKYINCIFLLTKLITTQKLPDICDFICGMCSVKNLNTITEKHIN